MCSVFLQVPTQDEDSFTVVCGGEFLSKLTAPCPDSIKVLKIPVLCKHDINFESITDLIGKGNVSKCVNGRKDQLTSMWRSVALVNESITIDNTSGSDKCAGCVVPTAATWFLKYIFERNAPHEHVRQKLHQWLKFG